MSTFDVVIIGSGPGGYVAAIRAAQLGLKTAVVEANHLGGICLNWGCIPTKALLRSAEIYRYMSHAESFGLKGEFSFDFKKIVERSRKVAGQLSTGVQFLLKKNKVQVFDGWGRLTGSKNGVHAISVEKDGKNVENIQAKHVILATGARARDLPGLEADGKLVWNYKHALDPSFLPKSMVVIGSGAIGIEFASFYHTFGCDVTVVEVQDRVMPVEDVEISEFAQKSFEKQGIKILTKSTVTHIDRSGKQAVVTVKTDKGEKKLTVDCVLSAVGIVGNVENIGLENTKIKVDRTHVGINEWCETAEKGIYAIGDIAGAPWLAHKASHEGIICVEKIAGVKDVHPLNVNRIPGCTYAHPQVASVGLTEKDALAKGYKIKVGRFPFVGNGKAIALGEPEGLVKTIFDEKTGELLGAHMVGAEVTELIQGYGIAQTLETTEKELMHTVFAHPTLSEMMHESVLNAYGQSIHI